jgi:hypothetical protein
MACPIDVVCECSNVWEVDKGSMLNDTPTDLICPSCGSKKIRRLYGKFASDVAEGICGNAKTKYERSHTYHPSTFIGLARRGQKVK